MTLTHKISQSLINYYSAGPSPSRISEVKSLQETIREILSQRSHDFDTFLQGSYRNNTAIADINDVDIVALYDPWSSPESPQRWESLFRKTLTTLRQSYRLTGELTLGDKCIKLHGDLDADIVPAISRTSYSSSDPIRVYSRNEGQERDNFPRTHYDNGVSKQSATQSTYKPTVRMFKRWVRQYPNVTAPSFYIECAVHSINAKYFDEYLPLSFASVGTQILEYSRWSYIPSVAGDKDILVSHEWNPSDFEEFKKNLSIDVRIVLHAMQADSIVEADRLWRRAFGA